MNGIRLGLLMSLVRKVSWRGCLRRTYHVISLSFHLKLIFSLHCQLFLLISGVTKYAT